MKARTPSATPFPIRTPRQLLEKAKREIDRLEHQAEGFWGDPDPVSVADLTFNAACTLWHVTDWIGYGALEVVHDVVPRQMKTPARVRTDRFQRRLRVLSPDLRICWGLALRFKHLELETVEAREMFEEDATISIRPVYQPVDVSLGAVDQIAIPLFSSVAPPLRVSDVGFSAMLRGTTGGPSSSTPHPKVTTRRKQRLRLTEVYGSAYTYLDGLLKKHGL